MIKFNSFYVLCAIIFCGVLFMHADIALGEKTFKPTTTTEKVGVMEIKGHFTRHTWKKLSLNPNLIK